MTRRVSSQYHKVQDVLRGKPRRWCVTGAAGFIGSHLVEKLLELGQEVLALDNLSTGFEKNLKFAEGNPRFQFLKTDIQEISASVFRGVHCLLHQAALGSVPRSIENPLRSHESNVTGFLNTLLAAKDAGVGKVVYASSSSVYGDEPMLPMLEHRVGSVLSPYAATKKINEVYAEAFFKAYGLKSIGLRYFNVFGPRQDPSGAYAAVIPRWIKSLLEGETCTIYGDGETSRDFSYVDNIVQANILAAFSELETGVFNIACGETMSLNTLYQLLATEVCGESYPAPTRADFRKGDIRHSFADIRAAKDKLFYSPTVLAREGISKTVSAYRS